MNEITDTDRIDWLAEVNNKTGTVMLPSRIVEANLHSLRDAIDAAMREERNTGGESSPQGVENVTNPPRFINGKCPEREA